MRNTKIGKELTVGLVHSSIDDIGSAIVCHITNAKSLPVSEQANQVSANSTATHMEAKGPGSGLDVQEA